MVNKAVEGKGNNPNGKGKVPKRNPQCMEGN
jgi:hypothetical protein